VIAVIGLTGTGAAGAALVGERTAGRAAGPEPGLEISHPSTPDNMRPGEDAEQRHGRPERDRLTPAHLARPAATQIGAQPPIRVTLPSGAQVRVLPASTNHAGVLEVPEDIERAGWWDGSSRIGDPFGSIVVAAHVDSFTQGIGTFAQLLAMHPGDEVQLESVGLRQSFRVVTAHLEAKTSLADDSRVFAPDGDSRLVLLTCGGTYDPILGGYQDNMVVIALPTGRPSARVIDRG
jgi:hypothetical protein